MFRCLLVLCFSVLTLLDSLADVAFSQIADRALRVAGIGQEGQALADWKAAVDPDTVLVELKPEDPKNSQAWAIFGFANEVLDRPADAEAAYEKVLSLRRTHGGVRMRLYLMREEAAEDLLEPFRLAEFSRVGALLADRWHGNEADAGKVLGYLNAAAKEGREKANVAWVLEIASQLARDQETQDDYVKLCKAMVKVPALAEEGYSRVMALPDVEAGVAQAIEALVSQMRAARSFRAADYGLDGPPLQSPAEAVLRHALTEADESWAREEVVPQIKEAGGARSVTEFEALMELYFGDQGSFIEQALAFTDRRAAKRARVPVSERLDSVIAAWTARRLKSVSMKPVFEPQVMGWIEGASLPRSLSSYAREVGLSPFLEEMAMLLSLDFSKNLPPDGFEPPEGLPPHVETFFRVLQQVSEDPTLFWRVLDYYESRVAPVIPLKEVRHRAVRLGAHPLLDSATYDDLVVVTKHLRESPFLGGVKAFRSFPRTNGNGSFFADVVQRIRQLPPGKQRLYQVMLANLTESFGRDFLMAAIDEKPVTKIGPVLVANRDALESLSHTQQEALAYELNRLVKPGVDLEELDEEAREIVVWLRQVPESSAEAGLNNFLTTTSLSALGLSESQVQTQVRRWMRALAKNDRPKAKAVFRKAVTLVPETTFANQLVSRVMAGTQSVAVVDLCLGLIADPKASVMVQRDSVLPYAVPFLAGIDATDEDWERQLGVFFQSVAVGIQETNTLPLMIDGLWKGTESLAYGKRERFESMVSWLESDHFIGQHSALALWCSHMAKLHQDALTVEEKAEKPVDLATVWESFESVFDKGELSLSGKIAFAESLANLVGEALPKHLLERLAETLTAGLSDGVATEKQLYAVASVLVARESAAVEQKRVLVKVWEDSFSDDEMDGGVASALLGLALQGGEKERIDAVIARLPQPLDFRWLSLLFRAGETERAAAWLHEGWARFDWLNGIRTGPRPSFDRTLAEKLPALREALGEADELSFYAEALVAALPDGESVGENEANRQARLVGVAKSLTEHAWQDLKLEATVLSLIAEEPMAARHLESSYRRVGEGIDLDNLPALSQVRERRCLLKLLEIHGRQSLAEGPQVLAVQLETVLRRRAGTGEDLLTRLVLGTLEKSFLEDWASWEPDVLSKNLSLLPLATDLDAERWLSLGWAMHLLADDEGGLVMPAQIRRAKPAKGETTTPAAVFVREVLDHVTEAVKRAGLEEDSRRTLAVRLSSSRPFMDTLIHLPDLQERWLERMKRQGWLNDEALIQHAHDMAKAAPRQGWAWREAAGALSKAQKHPESLACWNEAVKFAGKDQKSYSVFQLGRINQLLKLDRGADALRALKVFDKKKLHPDYKEEFEFLQKKVVPQAGKGGPVV